MTALELQTAMEGWMTTYDPSALVPFGPLYFASISELIDEKGVDFTLTFIEHMLPTYMGDEVVIDGIDQTLQRIQDAPRSVIKRLKQL
jgi:hypothetical protein